ncbi:CNBD2 [Branchiostoma lanceolatum]|uniref:CNBD2 protein n=1 Tax=Branchiostoma lanceolatum TaxID=7740 RepID=A0A8J9VJ84_BRALA|nr:CNBD2 [Branchiostoma lanceolatum]
MAAGPDTSPPAGFTSSSAEGRQRTLRHLLSETPTFFKSPRQVNSASTTLSRNVFDKRLFIRPQSCTAENRRKALTASYPVSGTHSPMSRPRTSFSPRTPSERDRCATDSDSTARRPRTYRSYTASPLVSESQQDLTRHVTEAWSRVRRESLRRRMSRMTPEQRDSFRLLHNPAFQAARCVAVWKRARERCTHSRQNWREGDKAGIARFHHAARLVILVHRLRVAMTTLSRDRTVPTAAEMRFHTLHHDERVLAFNKDMYARRTEATMRLPRWATDIMGKPPRWRSEQECRRLHALLRCLKAFRVFSPRIQAIMCRSILYQFIEAERVVLRKGHHGSGFYFVYSGSVFVNAEDKNQATGEAFMRTEAVLGRGDSFGEIALLRGCPRTASVTVREPCELLIVDDKIFAEVCPKIFDAELDERVKFLRQVPLFAHRYWPPEALRQLCIETQMQEFKSDHIIVDDSEEDEWIYVCAEGQCKVLKSLVLEKESLTRPASPRGDPPSDVDTRRVSFAVHDDVIEDDDDVFHDEDQDSEEEEEATIDRSESMRSKSERMLRSIRGDHAEDNDQDPQASMDVFTVEVDDGSHDVSRAGRQRRPPEELDMTLRSLIEAQLRQRRKNDVVYVEIGILKRGDIFGLQETVGVSDSGPLILMSFGIGTRIYRLKRTNFRDLASEEATEHAKLLGYEKKYPSAEALLIALQEQSKWDVYKQTVVEEVLRHHRRPDRFPLRSPTEEKLRSRKVNRLVSTLSRCSDDILGLPGNAENTRKITEPIDAPSDDREREDIRRARKFDTPIVMRPKTMVARCGSMLARAGTGHTLNSGKISPHQRLVRQRVSAISSTSSDSSEAANGV